MSTPILDFSTEEEKRQERERWDTLHAMPRNQERAGKAASAFGVEVEELIAAAGVPRRALEVLSAAQDTLATDAVAGDIGLLVLSGSPGSGKTVAAAKWIALYYRDRKNWRRRAWMDGREEDSDVGYAFSFGCGQAMWIGANAMARIDHYGEGVGELAKVSRLVIDDLGAEYLDAKGFYLSMLDEVLNDRYAAKRPTLMTTNLDRDGFKARYGERIADRVREAGRFVGVGNVSMRGRTA